MRHLLLLFLVLPLLAAGQSSGSSIFEDALELRSYLTVLSLDPEAPTLAKFSEREEDQFRMRQLLARYAEGDAVPSDPIGDFYRKNPYFTRIQGKAKLLLPGSVFQSVVSMEGNVVTPPLVGAPGPGGIGGIFSATRVADGIARFLVARTKEELTVSFFRKFQAALTENPEIGIMFPATENLLESIDKDIYQYKAYLSSLRYTFLTDLNLLPANLRTLLIVKPDLIDLPPQTQILAEDLLAVSQQLLDKKSAPEALNFLATTAQLQQSGRLSAIGDTTKRKQLADVAAGFQLVNLLSASLLDSESEEDHYLPMEMVAQQLNDPAFVYVYLGLLWQRAEGIAFSNGSSVRNYLGTLAQGVAQYNQFRNSLRLLSYQTGELDTSLDSLKAYADSNNLAYDHFYRYFRAFSGIAEQGLTLYTDFTGTTDSPDNLTGRTLTILRSANELNFNIRKKNYVYGITNLTDLLNALVVTEGGFPHIEEIRKYGTFIATVAQTEDSQEISDAIALIALPAGSANLKKSSKWSFAIGAYSGINYGYEDLDEGQGGNVVAVSAPVGLTVSKGLGRIGSVSLYVPAIDVGAFTAYRFNNNDNVEKLPELEWGNLFAPGAHLIYGLPGNLPIAVGGGFQRGPNIRKIDLALGNGFDNTGGYRWLMFVAVDIPISYFYSK